MGSATLFQNPIKAPEVVSTALRLLPKYNLEFHENLELSTVNPDIVTTPALVQANVPLAPKYPEPSCKICALTALAFKAYNPAPFINIPVPALAAVGGVVPIEIYGVLLTIKLGVLSVKPVETISSLPAV